MKPILCDSWVQSALDRQMVSCETCAGEASAAKLATKMRVPPLQNEIALKRLYFQGDTSYKEAKHPQNILSHVQQSKMSRWHFQKHSRRSSTRKRSSFTTRYCSFCHWPRRAPLNLHVSQLMKSLLRKMCPGCLGCMFIAATRDNCRK